MKFPDGKNLPKTLRPRTLKPRTPRKLPKTLRPYDEPELDRFDVTDPMVQERLKWFCHDTTENIMRNFDDFQISTHRTDGVKYTGDLERSIHWTIVNSAGGNVWLIEFYYLYYGRFLELSASGFLSGPGKPYPPIRSGMVPAMMNRTGVQVGNRPWKAKPFITSEIRRQAKKLASRMAKQFAYAGGMRIFHTFVTEGGMREPDINFVAFSKEFWEFINDQMKDMEHEIKLI